MDDEAMADSLQANVAKMKISDGRCVFITGLTPDITEAHIASIIDSTDLHPPDLEHSLMYSTPSKSTCRKPNASVRAFSKKIHCWVEFKSSSDAQLFFEVFAEKTRRLYLWKGGMRAKVRNRPNFHRKMIEELQSSTHLKISNLHPNVTKQELKEYIKSQCNLIPLSIRMIRHRENTVPQFAFVQMRSKKDATILILRLQMTQLEERSMFIRFIKDPQTGKSFKSPPPDRGFFYRASSSTLQVTLYNLPHDIAGDRDKIKKLVQNKVNVDSKEVQIIKDEEWGGFLTQSAIIKCETHNDAVTVFDGMNGVEINRFTLSTSLQSQFKKHRVGTNVLGLSGLPRGVDCAEICHFVKRQIKDRPLQIRVWRNNERGSDDYLASVVLCNYDDVVTALQKLQGKKINGVKVNVFERYPFKEEQLKTLKNSKFVSIKSLSSTLTKERMMSHFQKYSKVEREPKSVELKMDLKTKERFVVVELQSHADAQLMVDNLCLTKMGDQKCWVEFGRNESDLKLCPRKKIKLHRMRGKSKKQKKKMEEEGEIREDETDREVARALNKEDWKAERRKRNRLRAAARNLVSGMWMSKAERRVMVKDKKNKRMQSRLERGLIKRKKKKWTTGSGLKHFDL